MADWKEQLNLIIQNHEAKKRTESEHQAQQLSQVERFINDVALAAFKSLAGELEKHGRKTEISIMSSGATLWVRPMPDEDEFSYGVEIRNGLVIPYTQREDSRTKQVFRGEGYIYGDVKDRIEKLTPEDLIRDFLEEYTRFLR